MRQSSQSAKIIKPTREQLAASDPKRTIWVSANAGSGKTQVLVDRVVRLMLDGAEPETILCLTFTKAAAAEMKNRLFKHLSTWTLATDEILKQNLEKLEISTREPTLIAARQLFTKALETPGGLKIQTIHAFAEKLLQLFPVEAGIAPGFKVLEDRATEDMISAARSETLDQALGNGDSDLAMALAQVGQYASERTFDALLKGVFAEREVIKELIGSDNDYQDIRAYVAKTLGVNAQQNRNGILQEITSIDVAVYSKTAEELRSAKHFSGAKRTISEFLRDVVSANQAEDRLQAILAFYFTKKREPRKEIYAKVTEKNHPDIADWFAIERERIHQLVEIHDLHLRVDMTASLLYLAQSISEDFEHRKRAASAYDFSDLIARASNLLRNSPMTQWVLYKLDRGINHILVDEAQDTSPDQWNIIRAIADEFFAGEGVAQKVPRTLFVVGDQKQSIFSFQGADAKTFQDMRDEVKARVVALGKQPPQISLLTSYRSVPEVLDFVDAVFPDKASVDMGLSPTDDERRKHESNRKESHGIVQLWPLIENDEAEEPDYWLVPVDRQPKGFHRRLLARKIATTVRSWIGKRIIPSIGRTVVAEDILILLQTRGELFAMIIAELRALGIEVAGADRITLMDSLSVQDLLAFAQVMVLPDDDYSLACILKSPFMPDPLDDDELMQLCLNRESEPLRARLHSAQDAKTAANARFIEVMAAEAEALGPFGFFSKLLSLYRKQMQLRLGPESLDATNALLDIAIDYEYEQGTSLAGFVAWFQSGETILKREMQRPNGQVRLMTVHGAKGLESEIVIIPDAADRKKKNDVSLVYAGNGLPVWAISDLAPSPLIEEWKETKKRLALEEHKRLLYVALTRAKDELYIAGSRSVLKKKDGSDSELKDTWYHFIQTQLASQQDVVMEQIEDPFSNGPVLHFGAHPTPAQPDHKPQGGTGALPSWLYTAATLPPVPNHWTVTRLAGQNSPTLDAKEGVSFGTKVHEFFRLLPSLESGLRPAYAEDTARRLGLDLGFLRGLMARIEEPDMAPFFGSLSLAEIEILARLPSGRDMSGRIDRLRITDELIYLLDYKSDASPPLSLTADNFAVRQIALYSQSVSQTHPGRDVKVAIFWTAIRRIDMLSPSLVTQACDLALRQSEPFQA